MQRYRDTEKETERQREKERERADNKNPEQHWVAQPVSDESDNIYSNVVEASNANGSVKASDRICCEDISLRTVSANQSNLTIIIENIIPNNTLEAN